jgi:hypothetical protein
MQAKQHRPSVDTFIRGVDDPPDFGWERQKRGEPLRATRGRTREVDTSAGGRGDDDVVRASARWPVPAPACPAGDCGVRSPGFKPKGPRSTRGPRVRERPGG